jgi:hypothetical protein
MASVSELISLADREARISNPGASALQSMLMGVDKSVDGGLDRAIKLIQLEQMREQNEIQKREQAQMAEYVKKQLESDHEDFVKRGTTTAGTSPRPVMPKQKLEMTIEQNEKGQYSKKFKVVEQKDPEAPSGYRWKTDGTLEAIPGGPATNKITTTPPAGYRWKADGTLEAIPGGPADQKTEQKMDELQVPGWELTGTVRPKPTEAEKLRSAVGSLYKFENSISAMKKFVDENGSFQYLGEAGADMRGLATDLQMEAKELYNLGVLNGQDFVIISKAIASPDSLGSFFTRSATRQAELDRVLTQMREKVDSKMKSTGYVRSSENDEPPPPPSSGDASGQNSSTPKVGDIFNGQRVLKVERVD